MTEKKITKKEAAQTAARDPERYPFGVSTDSYMVDLSAIAHLTSKTNDTATETAICSDSRGEFVPGSTKTFNSRINVTETWTCCCGNEITIPGIAIGATAVDNAIDSITVTTAKGQYATITVTGHTHTSSDHSHNIRARTITIPPFARFGASDFGAPMVWGSPGPDLCALQSATYRVDLGHTDEQTRTGDFLVGTTHGEKHTLTLEWLGSALALVNSPLGGWVSVSKSTNASNTTHAAQTITFEKHVGLE